MKVEEFGEYIKKFRKQRNLTIRQLELYSGVSNSYLSQLENGKRGIPSAEILKKLSGPLDVPQNELMIAAGYIDDDGEKELKAFIHDPELRRWHRELPQSPEEDLLKLRKMWEIMKGEKD
ncbi:helix-turn-helix transcriptional regulator [Bacillus sp. FJAT-49732]|uniref:Helix-turn-helix transcriptional regulator n=1 Tax=Lederbergia citrisecunda TaxID=2833583 RepID=A0A942YMN5_9BACI|nr:helix-turn-helix transcriptional regulator [Lederbergia citrisecunda]MBS4201857.1 helix-turn-helix transcriptional regulator [Lederbergia citrisecunda]